MALAVTELVATHAPFVAGAACAPALARVAVRTADAARTATTLRALGVAVDVIARLATAEPGVVGFPPARGERARRTRVSFVVDRAAERRPPRRTVGRGAAQRCVGSSRSEQIPHRIHRQRRADDGG